MAGSRPSRRDVIVYHCITGVGFDPELAIPVLYATERVEGSDTGQFHRGMHGLAVNPENMPAQPLTPPNIRSGQRWLDVLV